MYAITGITGKVGGVLACNLLAAGQPVRAIVRDAARAHSWKEAGCELAVAQMDDQDALAAAFEGATGVFILLPPQFDPASGFPESRAVIDAVSTAIRRARPAKVVCLSTIGAQAPQTNLLTQLTLMEQTLKDVPVPLTFLRPGWFMENAAWDVASAQDDGVILSYLQPFDRPVPMVSTIDVGRVAAGLIQENWSGIRVIELEGPRRVSPNDIATAFTRVLQRPVAVKTIDRQNWQALFHSQGMQNPEPRIRMLDGFNQGWIDFEGNPDQIIRGEIELATVIEQLVSR